MTSNWDRPAATTVKLFRKFEVMWPEIEKALKEKRHELKLLPDNVNKDLNVDESLFLCQDLNLLTISDTKLVSVPEDFSKLVHLQNLLLFRNKIVQFPSSVPQLAKLKVGASLIRKKLI